MYRGEGVAHRKIENNYLKNVARVGFYNKYKQKNITLNLFGIFDKLIS